MCYWRTLCTASWKENGFQRLTLCRWQSERFRLVFTPIFWQERFLELYSPGFFFLFFFFFHYLAPSIKMIPPSGRGFHQKHFKVPLKKVYWRVSKMFSQPGLERGQWLQLNHVLRQAVPFFYNSSWKEWEFVVVFRGRNNFIYQIM